MMQTLYKIEKSDASTQCDDIPIFTKTRDKLNP